MRATGVCGALPMPPTPGWGCTPHKGHRERCSRAAGPGSPSSAQVTLSAAVPRRPRPWLHPFQAAGHVWAEPTIPAAPLQQPCRPHPS